MKILTFLYNYKKGVDKMRYMGSKSKIKKEIVPILQEMIDNNEIKTYVEPFVGGANVIDTIRCERRIGGDNHEYLIALLKHVRDGGELPTEVSKELYDDVRKNKNTKQYSTSKDFNHDIFWEWARQMSKKNIVVISELQAPDDFECIWERKIMRTMNVKNTKESTEKLFIYKGDANGE